MLRKMFMNTMELNLSKEVIEKNHAVVIKKIMEEKEKERLERERLCGEYFKKAAELVMTSQEGYSKIQAPMKGHMDDCSQFAEFKKIMNKNGVDVSVNRHGYQSSITYYIFEKRREISFV